MSLQATINLNNKNNLTKKLEFKDNSKGIPRAVIPNKINTKDIFYNKSESKEKSTTRKFNIQKQNQKIIFLVKNIKQIENNNYLTKKVIIKTSKNNSLSKPLSINSSRKQTINRDCNNKDKNKENYKDNNIDKKNKIYHSKTIDIKKNESKNNVNINSNTIKEKNNKTIKNICSNLKYKTTTFIPKRMSTGVNKTINNHSINNPFEENNFNNSCVKSNNPFLFMNQPISPMTLEMEKFKKTKLKERKNTEKNLKIAKKREYNSINKGNKNSNKIKKNTKVSKNEYNLDKYKDYFQTETSEKYDKKHFKLEKYEIPKINKESTLEVDTNIYQISYTNSNKYKNIYTEESNINPQEYMSINNSIEFNNIYSISSSSNNNLNESEKSKDKDSLKNKKTSILYTNNNYNNKSLKTSSFTAYNSKTEQNLSKDNNIILNNKNSNLNKFMNTFKNKSLGFTQILNKIHLILL